MRNSLKKRKEEIANSIKALTIAKGGKKGEWSSNGVKSNLSEVI
jgi:hypothetical protein